MIATRGPEVPRLLDGPVLLESVNDLADPPAEEAVPLSSIGADRTDRLGTDRNDRSGTVLFVWLFVVVVVFCRSMATRTWI